MARLLKVRSFNPDGSATLEDGREMQVVMNAGTGALGCREKTDNDRLSQLDQYVPIGMEHAAAQELPSMASLGLDQG